MQQRDDDREGTPPPTSTWLRAPAPTQSLVVTSHAKGDAWAPKVTMSVSCSPLHRVCRKRQRQPASDKEDTMGPDKRGGLLAGGQARSCQPLLAAHETTHGLHASDGSSIPRWHPEQCQGQHMPAGSLQNLTWSELKGTGEGVNSTDLHM